MDLELNADQRALHEAIINIVSRHQELPRIGPTVKPVTYYEGEALSRELEAGEFFSIALTEGFGALEAGLLVFEAARSPQVVETAGSALIAPLLTGEALPRPIAVARSEDLTRAVRFLDRAKTLIIDLGDDVAVLSTEQLQVRPVHSMFAYPLGRLEAAPDLTRARRVGAGGVAKLSRLWRLALAFEMAGAMQAAIDFTTDYVKSRKVFARPVGSYQAVQHRLATDVQKARGAYWLALKAAWSGRELDAAAAALYAQEAVGHVIYDTHQFNGALGMTLEHALHFWTFRLRILEGELGGATAQGRAVATLAWPA